MEQVNGTIEGPVNRQDLCLTFWKFPLEVPITWREIQRGLYYQVRAQREPACSSISFRCTMSYSLGSIVFPNQSNSWGPIATDAPVPTAALVPGWQKITYAQNNVQSKQLRGWSAPEWALSSMTCHVAPQSGWGAGVPQSVGLTCWPGSDQGSFPQWRS